MMNNNVAKEINKSLLSFAPLKGKTVCVAFSGGADSVCLLHYLNYVKHSFGFNIKAVHINHHLRDIEADRDASFCKEFCKSYKIPFEKKDVYVSKLSNKGESLEEAARRLRYNALFEADFDFLATAHHLDDNIETFIINLLRGSGLKGLCGIPDVRNKIIRPLLNVDKNSILEYVKENNLSFVNDSSNDTDDYTRNIIRHKITPVLRSICPSFSKVFTRNTYLLKCDEDYIDDKANELYDKALNGTVLDVKVLKNQHFSLVSRVLRTYTKSFFGITPDLLHIKEFINIINAEKGSYQLGGNIFAVVNKGVFYLENREEINYIVTKEIISIEKYKNLIKINNLLLKNAVDCDKIIGELSFRTRNDGDRIRPKGRGLTKTVRKLQQELNIPSHIRPNLPVVTDRIGIVWCYKIGADERVSVDGNTKNVLVFKVSEVLK